MIRKAIAVILFCAAAHAAGFTEPVDLNAAGALESLRIQNPAHYEKVRAILAIVEARPRSDVTRLIEARFDATEVQSFIAWRVSNPPKLHVAFTLEQTRYTVWVVPTDAAPKLVPLR